MLRMLPAPRGVRSELAGTEWGGSHPHKKLVEEVARAGFVDISTGWRGTETRFDSPQEFWSAQCSIVTEIRKRLPILGPEVVDAMHGRFLAAAQATLDKGGTLVYPYGAFFVGAKRPGSQQR
jgi:hypothetical protein